MGQKVLNKRSVQVVNNGPKLPTPEQLEYGELAINYADGHETLAIKNNQNEIVPFSSDEKIYDNVQIQIDNALVPVLSAITDITSAITDDEFVVATALADLDDRITSINNYSEELDNLINELSGSVMDNYALSAVTHQEIEDAKGDVLVFVNNLSGSVSAFSASVVNTYATSAKTHSAIASASGNVYNTATAYTKTVSGNIEKNFNKYATSANTHNTFTAVGTRIDNLSSDLNTLSGAVSAFNASMIVQFATKAEASEYAAVALANSVSYTDSVSGNIEQNFKKYATSAQTHGAITALGTRIDNVNTTINGLSGSVSAFSASVISKYATSANTHSAIAAASGNVYNTATAYTKTVSGNIEKNFGKYATSANTHSTFTAVGTRIDNLSSDLNALSGAVSAFNATMIGDFATKSEASEYAAAALANAMDYTDSVSGNIEQNFGKYATSAQTHGAVTALGTRIDNVNTTINGLSGSVSAFSASVISKYATSANTHNAISTASGNVYKSATAYTKQVSGYIESNFGKYATSANTHAKIESVKSELNNRIDGVSTDVSNLSGSVIAFSGVVRNNYATKAEASQYAAAAYANAMNYTDSVSGNIEQNFKKYPTSAQTHGAITALGTRIDNVNTTINGLSGSVSAFSASVVSLEGDLIDRIESALTIVYKYKGTVTSINQLLSITNASNGDVYNLTVASGDTPPGTNYAWNETENTWDALGGSVDLSNYVTQDQLSAATATTDNVMRAVYYVSGAVSAFSASVISKYATSANTHSAIAAASGNVYNSATAYTKTVSGNIEKNFGKYATSANTHNTFTAVGTRIDNLSSDLNALSGAVSAFNASMVGDFATKAEASEYASMALSNAIDYVNEASGYIRTTLTGSYATSAQTHGAITAIGTRVDNISTSINGLSGSVSAFSASVISKYATSANTHNAIAAASGNVYNTTTAYTKTVSGNIEKNFGKYATSANTHSTFTAVGTRIDNLSSDLNALSGAVSAFNATMIGDFATKAEAAEYASSALINAIDYIDEASGYIRTTLTGSYATSAQTHGAITALGTRVDNANTAINGLSGSVSAFSASVISKYATSANTHSAIAAASGNVYNTATAYTKTVSGNIEQNFKKYATSAQTHGAITALGTRIDNANTAINGLSGSVSAFSAYVAYNYATKAEASEYASTAYSNATDYTDVVSGYIRTTLTGSYVTSAITHTAIKAVDSRVDGTIREIGYVSGGLYTFSASVVSKYATSANTHSAIAAASGNVYKSATAYTNTVSGNIEQNFKKYATSANTHNAISSTNTRIDNLTQEIIDNEFVTAHALNDLNDRLEDLFLTVVDLSTFADDFSFPRITEEDNGKILQVVNGKLTLVTPTSIYTGTGQPNNLLGNNGDIYIQTS